MLLSFSPQNDPTCTQARHIKSTLTPNWMKKEQVDTSLLVLYSNRHGAQSQSTTGLCWCTTRSHSFLFHTALHPGLEGKGSFGFVQWENRKWPRAKHNQYCDYIVTPLKKYLDTSVTYNAGLSLHQIWEQMLQECFSEITNRLMFFFNLDHES